MTNARKLGPEVLLIHAGVPKVSVGYACMLKLLEKRQIRTSFINVGNTGSEMAELQRLAGVKLVCFSIHWHPQLHESLKLAEFVRVLPAFRQTPIVIGGMTASCFAEELIRHPVVDYVIQGDGETALPLLVDHVLDRKRVALASIPNLFWKQNGVPQHSPAHYASDDAAIRRLEELLVPDEELHVQTGCVYAYGRGCVQGCPHCGGQVGAVACWRPGVPPLERSVAATRAVLRRTPRDRRLYLLSDYDGRCDFLAKCLEGMPHDLLTIDCTGLPSLDNARKIMTGPGSRKRAEVLWEISPEVGIDSLRAELRGRPFSNADLVSFLDAFFAEHANGKILLFFAYFYPGEDAKRLRTRAFIARLLKRFLRQIATAQLEICCAPLSTDPASPIQRGQARGIQSFVDGAKSYVREMLGWRHNFGNFLAHIPVGISRQEAMFLALYFRYETELIACSPQGYIGLVGRFRSFEAFDAYLREVFGRFHERHLRDLLQSNTAESMTESAQSLLGFSYSVDRMAVPPRLRFHWLSAIMQALPAKARPRKGAGASDDLLDELAFARAQAALADVCASWSKRPPKQHELLAAQGHKIDLVLHSRPLPALVPVRNRYVETGSRGSALVPAGWSCLSQCRNLILLGQDYFNHLMGGLRPKAMPAELRRSIAGLLEPQGRSRRPRTDELWQELLTDDEYLADTLVRGILFSHTPVEEIYDALGLPHDGRWLPDAFVPSQKHVERMCQWLVSFENLELDPRLQLLWIDALRTTCPLTRGSPALAGTDGCVVYHHAFRPDGATVPSAFGLTTLLTPYECELLDSCQGVDSLEQLAPRFQHGSSRRFRRAVAGLYARQLIF